MKIYVATSWRNDHQEWVVQYLQNAGHEVYDFKNPPHGLGGFHWSDIDPAWKNWTPSKYRERLLGSEIAARGFMADFRAMHWCDACVLVLPCGRSAHLELGWCAGRGKRTVILLSEAEPELMNLIADHICCGIDEVISALHDQAPHVPSRPPAAK